MTRYYYYKNVTNPVTGETAYLKASDKYSLSLKVQKQYERWERDRIRNEKAEKKQLAEDQTQEAEARVNQLNGILHATLTVDDRIDWESLKDVQTYPGVEPSAADFHKPSLSKSLSFISAFKRKAEQQAIEENASFRRALHQYEKLKSEWLAEQKKYNDKLEGQQASYEKGNITGVEDYVSLVLDRSNYPDILTINSELLYEANTKILLVEIDIPAQANIPRAISYKYVSAQDRIDEKQMTDKVFAQFYDETMYQIILRTIHEVFESDYKEFVHSVVLNANAPVTDKGTGKVSKKTIATVQAGRSEFMAIDLAKVEPQACFKHLKGMTLGPLIELRAVKPIMKLDHKDRRIIQAENILEEFDPSQNLAMMEWGRFEVLVRDLIQKEFNTDGSTVEVTRASHDAGVDAIAFDEDPIRGGKIIIQAKRYNNLVPVSAIRDLYGTVMNEGANKGIIITTSYYGPDAISFAKNKPLTLINGEELLYMFKRHGHEFKIELQKKRANSSKLI
jgi:restriction system protein